MNFVTKVWFYIIAGLVLFASIFISALLFILVLTIILITIPYALYLNWKTKKELEEVYNREKLKEDLKKLR